jgi:ATP-dependent Clp protease ATP-binding subunit ClpA
MLTQENLDHCHTENLKLTLVLFDEIEKASDALWQLLLGILDKAKLTLGDNRHVDFSKCMIIMTSNLGAREMSELISGGMGFTAHRSNQAITNKELDQNIYRTAIEAARRKFSPEFMNRIDKTVVFRSLKDEHLRAILDLELQAVQNRIILSAGTKFVFECSDETKEILLAEGIDYKYGARHLKRAIERLLVQPLSNLVATGQITLGDLVNVGVANQRLQFSRSRRTALVNSYAGLIKTPSFQPATSIKGGLGNPASHQASAAAAACFFGA